MTLFMLMNLGFAGSGAAPVIVVASIPRQSYAAIYRRSARIFIPLAFLMHFLEKHLGR